MSTVIIVIHLMVVLAMIGLILLQRSEGGALGIGGGAGAFMTGRSAGNVLSHTTAYLAIAFFVTSLALALLGKYQGRPSDILERLPGSPAPVTTETPAAPAPASGGAPTSAQDLLNQLGGSAGGPQTPPSPTPAPQGSAAPAPASEAPAPAAAPTPAPAAQTPAPVAPAPVPSPTPSPAPAQ